MYPRNLIGIKFGRLTVIKETVKPSHLKKKETYWICKCECGESITSGRNRLVTNHTTSCGCFRKETTQKLNVSHKMSETRFFKIWANMIQRCSNENIENYKHYGGRGIEVCNEWKKFENFMNDMHKSYIESIDNVGEKNTTLDRINVNEDYNRENCRWATISEQASNRRDNIEVEIDNVVFKTLKDVAEKYNINKETLRNRYHAGKRGKELIKPTGSE